MPVLLKAQVLPGMAGSGPAYHSCGAICTGTRPKPPSPSVTGLEEEAMYPPTSPRLHPGPPSSLRRPIVARRTPEQVKVEELLQQAAEEGAVEVVREQGHHPGGRMRR